MILSETMRNKIIRLSYELGSVKIIDTRKGSSSTRTGASGLVNFTRLRERIPFNSAVERDFLLTCKLDAQITDIVYQPFTLEFFSAISHKRRHYTADYLIEKDLSLPRGPISMGGPRTRILVEVKRQADLKHLKHLDLERMAAGVIWASQDEDWQFDLFTDFQTSNEYGEAVRFYSGFVGKNPTVLTYRLVNLLETINPLTFQKVNQALSSEGYGENQIHEAIYSSVANGWVFLEKFDVPSGQDRLILGDGYGSFDPNTR